MPDIQHSISFIREFVDKYLQGDIDKFKDFPLYNVKQDKVYGCPRRSFDGDDTEIMRHIYVVLFSDIWPGLAIESLKSGDFRGDTLNTYNTMFGRPDDLSPHPGLDRYETTDLLRRKVATFRYRFSFIGNMTVLPNLRVNTDSINTYRGKHSQWRDFFDRFLYALKDILTGKLPQDTGLANLIEANAKYFEAYKGEEGFRTLVDKLLLNDYVDSEYNPIISSKGYFFWKKGISSEEYEAEALRYIDFANAIIEYRTKIMVEQLTTFLQ